MRDVIHAYGKKIKILYIEYGKVCIIFCLTILSLVLVYILTILATPQTLRVSFLDVGQGDAIFVQTPSGKQMLIDGGVSDNVMSKISEEMSYFDRDIDVLVATHPDADHITGLIPVLKKYSIDTVVTSYVSGDTGIAEDLEKSIAKEGAHTYVAKAGDEIDFHDGVVAYIVYPIKNISNVHTEDTNETSVSVVIVYGEHSFLLTGDLPTSKESELLFKKIPQKITVYKAGHHGSKYSSGEQLLSYTKPEYSIISAGKNNRYGHPHKEVIERLGKYSKEIISTIDRGVITFKTDGKLIKVTTEK